MIQLLDGIVDIYLPDIKFLDPAASERYLDGAADYPDSGAHCGARKCTARLVTWCSMRMASPSAASSSDIS